MNLSHPSLTTKTVGDLIDQHTKNWKADLVISLFPFPLASTILQIPISKTNSVQDTLLWKYSKNGKYQVKKAYDFLARDHLVHPRHDQPQMGSWSRIWKVKVPLKVNNFIWKLMHDRLPTLLNLNIRGISTSNIYPLCNEGNCNSPLFTLSFC